MLMTIKNTRNKCLTAKLLKQGYRYHKLRKAFSTVGTAPRGSFDSFFGFSKTNRRTGSDFKEVRSANGQCPETETTFSKTNKPSLGGEKFG